MSSRIRSAVSTFFEAAAALPGLGNGSRGAYRPSAGR